jgi:hypothetical protein
MVYYMHSKCFADMDRSMSWDRRGTMDEGKELKNH